VQADFGLARLKQSEQSMMESAVGSLQYSCPEIVNLEPYGPNTDIWATGCILYELAERQPAFPGE
jgi:NIMA (never in mitosis gene a)-related kinase